MDMAKEKEVVVAIVGGGPSGLAAAACLNRLGIANIVLEREDCTSSLRKKRSYDGLKLHLAKQFCELPHMPFPANSPTFIPRVQFIEYLDDYRSHFEIKLYCRRSVERASYDHQIGKWQVVAIDTGSCKQDVYVVAEYLVVVSGENGEYAIPEFDGLESFGGKTIHSSKYRNGKEFRGKNVLVVGCGNSGMEIAYELWSSGANASIVARSPQVDLRAQSLPPATKAMCGNGFWVAMTFSMIGYTQGPAPMERRKWLVLQRFLSKGLLGVSIDARNVANDIGFELQHRRKRE